MKIRRRQLARVAGLMVCLLPVGTNAGDDHPAPKRPAREAAADDHAIKNAPRKTPAKAPAKATAEPAPAPANEASPAPDADAALRMLVEGNERWVAGASQHPATDSEARDRAAREGQKPFVAVLTCADSRLPVERVFDRGAGELFVVRVAGNIAGESEIGTIEYGVGHLHTPLLVVMGHTKCGAVAAAASGAEVHGKIAGILSEIAPAVERARKNNPSATPEELAAASVRENVWQTIFDLYRSSPDVRQAAARGQIKVVGAVCDVATGKVDFMGEHPWPAELFAALGAAPTAEHADAEEPAGH